MKSIFEQLHSFLQEGQPVVLATVIEAGGSTPRGPGARMIVLENGEMIGTIGGGQVEYLVAQDAKKMFESKESRERFFGLEKGGNAAMTCGGKLRVLLQYIEVNEKNLQLYEQIQDCISHRKNSWLCIPLSAPDDARLSIENPPPLNCTVRKQEIIEQDGNIFYVEMVSAKTALYLFGAGHVGQEVLPMMKHLGFYTVLVDPRKELANREIFPEADEIYNFPYAQLSEQLSVTDQDYVVVMTNTHHSDLEVMKQVLKKNPFYLGMMGSKKKISFITESLLEEGYTQEEIQQCYMPIGINILAETPAEIAVSVAGQIIQHRAKYW